MLKNENGTLLTGDTLWLEDDGFCVEQTAVSKRINIDYAQEAKDFLWRFYIPDNPYLSVKDKNQK